MAKLVETRTGRRVSWSQDGEGDAAVARKVHDLLAHELTVDTAVQVALLNNETLQATYEDLSVAQADLVQAGLLRNPVFGASVSFPVAGNAQTGASVSVAQEFLSVFLLAARKNMAEAELRATKLRVGAAVLRTAWAVETAFYDAAAALQIAAARRTLLDAGDAGLDLSRRLQEAGNISDLELATQETFYEQLRMDLLRSESDVVTTRESLTRLLGVGAADATYTLADKLPEIPRDEGDLGALESAAASRRFDLGAAHEEVQALSYAVTTARRTWWLGSTSIGGTYERSPEGFTVAGPNVGVELPLFDQHQAAIARLEAQLRAALARERALAVDVQSEVRAARARVLAARRVAERYDKVIVPLRQRVVDLSQEQFNAMLLGAYALLQAKQNAVSASRERVEALREYWVARADLERVTGGTVPRTPLAVQAEKSGAKP